VDGADSILEKNQRDISELPAGFMAERIIYSFFSRLSFDFPELPFEILDNTVYDDVYQKVDFKIKIKKEYIRALDFEICQDTLGDCKEVSSIGIQYTMDKDKKNFKEKQLRKAREHLDDVDDVVLITLPISGIRKVVEE
jgi:hypothetical protein